MFSAAMRTASATEARLNGRGARYRLIATAASAARQPSEKPNFPAIACRALICFSRWPSFAMPGRCRWARSRALRRNQARKVCVPGRGEQSGSHVFARTGGMDRALRPLVTDLEGVVLPRQSELAL